MRFASIGNNWNRTVTIYSGGKLFNATGWKVGWAIAHPKLLKLGAIMNNTLTYSCNTPAQIAISKSLPISEVGSKDKPSYVKQTC